MKLRNGLINVMLGIGLLISLQGFAETPKPNAGQDVTRELLQHRHLDDIDRDLVEYKVTYPPGASAPIHCHPVAGVGYMLSGEAQSQFKDGPIVVIHAGESFIDEAITPHTLFKNMSTDKPLVFLITYAIPPNTPTLFTGDQCEATTQKAK